MTAELNRRSFLGRSVAGVAVTAALAGPSQLAALLADRDASGRVFHILQQHLGLDPSHRAICAAFTRSLQESCKHHESGAAFAAKLAGEADSGETLAVYIVQQFVVSSNYTSYLVDPSLPLALHSTCSTSSPLFEHSPRNSVPTV